MGQAAFTIVGAVVGNFIAPGVGGAIGGAIGGLVGGALFPEQLPTIEGPQLDEKNIQVSTYGKAIGIPFGALRMAGNVIWATELRETRTETEQGGKGGGPVQSTVSYSYDADVAIAIGEGEIDTIRRIWCNGVLIWDARPLDDPSLLALYGGDFDAILRARSGSEIQADAFVFYHGDETQLPDATIEATEGVGNVPAYRGISYVVFTRFQLARWGNRLPQFEFEVVTSGTEDYGAKIIEEYHATPTYRNGATGGYLQTMFIPIISNTTDGIRVFGANDESVDTTVDVYGFDGSLITTDAQTDWELGFESMQIAGGSSVVQVWVMMDGAHCSFDLAINDINIVGEVSSISLAELLVGVTIAGCAVCSDHQHILVYEAGDGLPNPVTNWHLVKYNGMNSATVIDTGTINATDALNQAMVGVNCGVQPFSTITGHFQSTMMEPDLKHIWRQQGPDIALWTIDDTTGEMALDLSFDSGGGADDPPSSTPMSMYAKDGICVVIGGTGGASGGHWFYIFSRLPAIEADLIILGDIVAALCYRVGLTPAQIDVADLTTEVRGFLINQRMSARAAIEALMRAYNFDAAESGDQIIFRLRGTDSVLTLTDDDLGAAAGGQSDAALVVSERGQENELPNEVAVAYMDYESDFHRGVQAVRRMATQSVEKVDVALPVVLTGDEAAQAAEMLLYQSWVGRNRRSFSTTRAFSHIEPTDVITLEADGLSATVRVIHRKQSDGLINWTGIDVDSSTFTPNAVGAPLPTPDGIAILAPSHIHVLDIPALRSDDDDAGVYVAVYHPGSGVWSGAAILQAPSTSGPFTRISSAYESATVGMADTALGYYGGGNTFDELNTVTVQMFTGAPESATRDEVLNGANAAILGDEIIQWTTATDLGDSVYELSGLLRGRRATEQHISSHAVADRFVVLNNALVRVPLGSGVIGSNYAWRAVTFGSQTQNPVFDDQVRHIGGSIIPALVCNVTGVRTDAGVLIRWHRRDRLAWEWTDEIELPNSEDSERYTIEILSGGAGVPYRTINDITTNEYLYTAQQESEDFESIEGVSFPSAIRTVKIYQMSAQVGRGFVQESTLSGLSSL